MVSSVRHVPHGNSHTWHICKLQALCMREAGLRMAESTCRYLPDQFDIIMHIDSTSAVEPLFPGDHFKSAAETPDLPETFPFAV